MRGTSDITIDRLGDVCRIAINRPSSRNALRRETFEALRSALADLAEEGAARALILTGTGDAFCAGADLSDPMMGADLAPEDRAAACEAALGGLMNGLVRDLRDAPFPIIGAVNGIAAGGGVGLALAADLTIAATGADFIMTFTPKLGLVPDLGLSWHLAHRLGRSRAMGLVLTGARLSATEAKDLGLIWSVVDADGLEAQALELAQTLAAGPTGAQVTARRLLDGAITRDLDAQLDAEAAAQASLVGSDDAIEALTAFAERRPPNFRKSSPG
ncbi:hypothetical protein GQE99_01385 [Maritimibacter sp. DP07]|uniref:Enoyl-CoA hydratase n=1 Tax=Maritimibacter harenae TaxID=2606218 RepID=A0A845LWE7_9RHOB|nr:enoyl-CoA hydratase-related protein [Maritimibacter harenae]MZR11676.1 hypothetical protein [Maritimibacter harenae]